MSLYSFATLEKSPPSDDTLAILADALDGRSVAAERRILTSPDSRNPDEGLALLEAYVSIADRDIRQAILDTVIAIADSDPYRRSRAATAPRSNDPEG